MRNEIFFRFGHWRSGSAVKCGFLSAEFLESAMHEGAHEPAIDVLERRFTGGVMAAREHALFEVETYALE
jgi:hypothetical protein